VIIAGAGNDEVFANGGNNLFKLGGIEGAVSDGNDRYTGGNGADSFALFLDDRAGAAAGWGNDVITGFRLSEGDRLVAFNPTAGFWDNEAELLALCQANFITGTRSSNGDDLLLSFAGGTPAASSLTLRDFFGNNSGQLSTGERDTARGRDISDENLAGILENVIQDGGVSGAGYLVQAHNLLSDPFMF